MATSYDLGAVSTYALAVQYGFVGTIADWVQAIVSASETYDMLVEQIESLELNIPLLDSTLSYNDRAANAYSVGEYLRRLETLISTPLASSTIAGMIDTTKVYVYTGSETGYIAGNWYYYDGTAWVSGGVYNAEAITTDTTLTIAGSAADAKKVGDELTDIKADLLCLSNGGVKYENVVVETGKYVKKSNGDIANYPSLTTWAVSPLYRIPTGTYKIESNFNQGVGASSSSGFAVYGADMTFKTGGNNLSTLVIADDYAYIRMSHYSVNSDYSGLYVNFIVSELINDIPTLESDIDNLVSNVDVVTSRGDYAVDKVASFRSTFANRAISNDSVGASFTSASNYTTSGIRLTTYQTIFTFNVDTTVYADAGYVFKAVLCDSSGNIVNWPSSWTNKTILLKGKCYGIVMRKSNDGAISTTDAIHIYADMANQTIRHLNNIMRDEIVYGNSLDKYYDFYFKSVDTDNNPISFYSDSMERRSAIFSSAKPFTISLNHSDYVFRLYWYDNSNILHSYGWGRIWEVPASSSIGLSIKKADSTAFSTSDTPEKYITVYSVDESPKDYFLTEIENTISSIREEYTEPGLCFLLTTDQHTMSVQSPLKYDTISDMVVNMKAITKEIHIDGVLSLGDIADFKVGTESAFNALGITDLSYSNLDSVFYDIMNDAITKMASIHPNFYYVLGNHDDNRYINRDKVQASESAYDYTPGEVFSYYNARGTHNVIYNDGNNGLDYYVDFEQFKIRMFFIDANYYNATSQTSSYAYTKAWWYGYSDSTVTWLQNQLSDVPNDWSVIVCSHLSPIKEHNEDNTAYFNLANVKSAIQSFINNGGNYIATFYGHTHGDWSATTPWLEISFACQKCENYNITLENMPGIVWPTRTTGTYTEDCWNVVLILPKSRKIKVIRFGAGSDAEYSY